MPCRQLIWFLLSDLGHGCLVVKLKCEVWCGAQLLWITSDQGVSFSVLSATEIWLLNNLTLSAPPVILILSTASCSSAICKRSSTCAHLVQVLTLSLGECSGHLVQSYLLNQNLLSHHFCLDGCIRYLWEFP